MIGARKATMSLILRQKCLLTAVWMWCQACKTIILTSSWRSTASLVLLSEHSVVYWCMAAIWRAKDWGKLTYCLWRHESCRRLWDVWGAASLRLMPLAQTNSAGLVAMLLSFLGALQQPIINILSLQSIVNDQHETWHCILITGSSSYCFWKLGSALRREVSLPFVCFIWNDAPMKHSRFPRIPLTNVSISNSFFLRSSSAVNVCNDPLADTALLRALSNCWIAMRCLPGWPASWKSFDITSHFLHTVQILMDILWLAR